jgi:hypothetical protein
MITFFRLFLYFLLYYILTNGKIYFQRILEYSF